MRSADIAVGCLAVLFLFIGYATVLFAAWSAGIYAANLLFFEAPTKAVWVCAFFATCVTFVALPPAITVKVS